jgi:uncharacterized protein with PIN domain
MNAKALVNWDRLFSRDNRHLVVLGSLLAVGGLVFKVATTQLVPKTFGDKGPYRAAALDELASKKPMTMPSDAQCLSCHADVGEERKEALHKEVACFHCHGVGTQHMEEARKVAAAGGAPSTAYRPAEQWDGNFLTKQDLYVTKDRKACLSCHESVVGMPKEFSQIVVLEHLKEEEAEHPESATVCSECHDGHDTAP